MRNTTNVLRLPVRVAPWYCTDINGVPAHVWSALAHPGDACKCGEQTLPALEWVAGEHMLDAVGVGR